MELKLLSETSFMKTLVEDCEINGSRHERLMVKVLLLLSITLFGFQTKTNEKFEMQKFKLNSMCLYHIDRNTLIKKFGKPQKMGLMNLLEKFIIPIHTIILNLKFIIIKLVFQV